MPAAAKKNIPIPPVPLPKQHPLPNGNTLYYFENSALELLKLDITVEAGSSYQGCKCQAHAANQLFGEATRLRDAREVAEFIDFRGIVVERMTDAYTGSISFYFLRRYAEELFPLLREMFDCPLVTQTMFEAYAAKRRQQLAVGLKKTGYVARNRFYELIFGPGHPLGTYATPDAVGGLALDAVCGFIRDRYRLDHAHIVLSGKVDSGVLALAGRWLSPDRRPAPAPAPILPPEPCAERQSYCPMADAVQSTIRIGRLLPYAWDSADYARFMVLSTALGGYFGSRLMSSIREEKGYTYGIYSQTQIHRDGILFYIVADVAAESAQAAVGEVFAEMRRLQDEPLSDGELERVRNFMAGDFIRSIDGVFELSERCRQMAATGVTELLSANLAAAIRTVSPAQLQALARHAFAGLCTVVAGPDL